MKVDHSKWVPPPAFIVPKKDDGRVKFVEETQQNDQVKPIFIATYKRYATKSKQLYIYYGSGSCNNSDPLPWYTNTFFGRGISWLAIPCKTV